MTIQATQLPTSIQRPPRYTPSQKMHPIQEDWVYYQGKGDMKDLREKINQVYKQVDKNPQQNTKKKTKEARQNKPLI